ncbi:MAG: dienelactone hydrolase family protein [Gammaproteobacteria bacterium]|nr:dienelactone hydrolase family protein [Gammaproteobacteria bacterium]
MTTYKQGFSAPIELETGLNPSGSVIWLHGLGADGHDFEAIVPELGLSSSPDLRFIFPHAEFRPVTINSGQVMRAWYDMSFSPQGMGGNADHMLESESVIRGLIQQEMDRGIPLERIVLAGFSQGGAVALHTALRHPGPLAGVLALSTYVPFPELLPADPAFLPIFMAHGTQDPVIPLALARQGCETLVSLGIPVQWHIYPMPHSVCDQEIRDISQWIQDLLNNK